MKNTIDNFLNIHFMNGKLIEDLSKIRRKPSPNAGGDIARKKVVQISGKPAYILLAYTNG